MCSQNCNGVNAGLGMTNEQYFYFLFWLRRIHPSRANLAVQGVKNYKSFLFFSYLQIT